MKLRMYHFQDVDEITKEHIRDYDSDTNASLCGYEHHNLSSNGDIITLEWAKANIPSASANGTLCKKCAKIATKMLKEKETVEFEITEVNINRRARGTEWIRVKVYVDNELDDILWMNERDIKKNKEEFGKFRNSLEDFLNKKAC